MIEAGKLFDFCPAITKKMMTGEMSGWW